MLLAAGLAALACAAPAGADVTVSMDASRTIHVVGTDEGDDLVQITPPREGGVRFLRGARWGGPLGTVGPAIVAGPGCTSPADSDVRCAGATAIDVSLGSGRDVVDVNCEYEPDPVTQMTRCIPSDPIPPIHIHDGAGNDWALAQHLGTLVYEEGPGDDQLWSNAEETRVKAGPGADVYRVTAPRGEGQVLDYGSYEVGVNVTPDDMADDGAPGEGDYVVQTWGEGFGRVIGGAGDDHLVAAVLSIPQTLEGGPGNDRLEATIATNPARGMRIAAPRAFGGEGDDTLSGDWTARLEGGPGNDALLESRFQFGGPGNDALTAGDHSGVLDGGAGDDLLTGGPRDDDLRGGPGGDRMSGGPSGRDTLSYADRTAPVTVSLDDGQANDGERGEADNAGGGIDVVIGGSGDDVLGGDPGPQALVGGSGFDTADYSRATAGVTVTSDRSEALLPYRPLELPNGDDGVLGEGDDLSEIEGVLGGPFDDTLIGGDGAQTLDGGGGDDALDGAGGPDVLRGGPGDDDRADYSGRQGAVAVSLDGAPNDGEAAEGDLIGGDVEALVGGAGGDRLTGDAQRNALIGNAGNDRLDGAGGADLLFGAGGRDTISGGPGADAIGAFDDGGADRVSCDAADMVAADARDRVRGCASVVRQAKRVTVAAAPATAGPSATAARTRRGGPRRDHLRGGNGPDRLFGGANRDIIEGLRGDDRLWGDTGADRLLGGPGQDTIHGDEAPDDLVGGSGNDVLFGDTASDRLRGDAGDDQLAGASGDDTLDGGAGDDRLLGGYGHDNADGGQGADVVEGDEAPDRLSGGAGADALDGGSGADVLSGGDGDDHLAGGSGRDAIDSGAGQDVVAINDRGADASVDCGEGVDTLVVDPPKAAGGVADRLLIARGRALNCENIVAREPDAIDPRFGILALTVEAGEAVFGTPRDDKLLGGSGGDVLAGAGGEDLLWGDRDPGTAAPDVLLGGDGKDIVYGGGGPDAIDGGNGDDTLQGDDGADVIAGGAGNDRIRPGRGDDVVRAGAGDDVIRAAADGRGDRIDCGPGRDTAYVDKGDRVRTCERVRR